MSVVRHKLKKSDRIRTRSELEAIKTRGQKITGRYWLLQWVGARGDESRVGVITTRKSGPAHDRSRLRRVAREFFRLNRGQLPRGIDVVIVARAGSAQADNFTLREELLALWRRLIEKR